jgi:hypothetical protein
MDFCPRIEVSLKHILAILLLPFTVTVLIPILILRPAQSARIGGGCRSPEI